MQLALSHVVIDWKQCVRYSHLLVAGAMQGTWCKPLRWGEEMGGQDQGDWWVRGGIGRPRGD